MSEQAVRRVRAGLVFLVLTFLPLGMWASLSSRSFYDTFPGGGRQWVAGHGPYNQHLVSDAGFGFLAVAAVLALSALWMERRVVQVALVATVVHGLPHLLFHLRHPNDALGASDTALSNGGLALSTALALVLLVVVTRDSGSRRIVMSPRGARAAGPA